MVAKGPTAAMKVWANQDVSQSLKALDARAQLLKLSSQQGSGPSVASGLKAWHSFAVSLLGYQESATLPPRRPDDILRFVALFSLAGTAKTYVGLGLQVSCVVSGLADRRNQSGLAGAQESRNSAWRESSQRRSTNDTNSSLAAFTPM